MHPYKQLAPQSTESLSVDGIPPSALSTAVTLEPKKKGAQHPFLRQLPPELTKSLEQLRPPHISGLYSADTTADDSEASARDIIDKYSKFPPPNTSDILGDLEFMENGNDTNVSTTRSEESIKIPPPSPVGISHFKPLETPPDSSNNNSIHHSRTPSGSLLSVGDSLALYGENAKKSKDPDVLLSYAQILIKSVLSDNETISNNDKVKYLDQAHTLLKRAIKLGGIESQYYLGDAYFCGLFNKGKPEYSKALSCFESAGKSKHAESAYRTSICYRKGLGCSRDARKVIKFLEIASMNEHPVAMMEYGIYCFHGLMGMPEDTNTKKKGISWLRRANECATPLSCGAPYELALIYMNGFRDIIIKDVQYSIKLLFKATNLGHSKSAVVLGKAYEVGDVVQANADLSIHFYSIATELRDPEGMMGLCSWYFVGSENLPKDYHEAFKWALKAAEMNNSKAMLLLQRFYKMGLGCDRDETKSQYWSNEAKKIEKSNNARHHHQNEL